MDTDLLVEELAAVRGELTRVDTKASITPAARPMAYGRSWRAVMSAPGGAGS
jgi:hypothetical protein